MSNNAGTTTGFQDPILEQGLLPPFHQSPATPIQFYEPRGIVDYQNSYTHRSDNDALREGPIAVLLDLNGSRPGVWIALRVLQDLRARQKELFELRGTKLTNSVRLREKRKALRESRDRASQKLAEFADAVREFSQGRDRNDLDRLDPFLEHTRTLHDVYGTLEHEYYEAEDDYMDLEKTYNSKEWEYTKRETEVQNILADLISGQTFPPPVRSNSSYSKDLTPTRSQEVNNRADGVQQYRDILAKVAMCEEALRELKTEREAVLEEQQTQHERGRELHESNQQFLDNFQDMLEEAEQERREAVEEVEDLRRQLWPSPRTPRTRRASSTADATRGTMEHWALLDSVRRPEMQQFSDPGLWSIQSENGLQTLKRNFKTLRQRISDWILDNLVTNRLDKTLHRLELQTQFQKAQLDQQDLSDQEWWGLVRQYWDKGLDWNNDLENGFETLKDSYTEYKNDESNAKELSAPSEQPKAELERDSSNTDEWDPIVEEMVWPQAEDQPVALMHDKLFLFPPTPPESVRDSKGLRAVKSTSTLRTASPPTDSNDTLSSRKSWSGEPKLSPSLRTPI